MRKTGVAISKQLQSNLVGCCVQVAGLSVVDVAPS